MSGNVTDFAGLQVSIVALKDGQIQVVQSSMLGSILSNLLLVMGMCFFLGGIWNWKGENGEGVEQSFASATAQTTCSLMALSSASLVIPATVRLAPLNSWPTDLSANVWACSCFSLWTPPMKGISLGAFCFSQEGRP
jgi:calcium/proton exchanger cax